MEPCPESAGIQPIGLRLGQHPEQRVHARFHGPLAEQVGAKSVDGIDVRLLERLERMFEALSDLLVGRRATGDRRTLVFERLAQAQLELAGSLFRERHGDDPGHRRAARREDPQDAVDQFGRLARSGGRLDDERVVEGLDDGPARFPIRDGNVRCHRQGHEDTKIIKSHEAMWIFVPPL